MIRILDCGDVADVIWLVILSTALIMLWGASERWDLSDLRRRVRRALHLDGHSHRADHRR